MLVGGTLGSIGAVIDPQLGAPAAATALVALGLVVAAREFGMLAVPLPQMHRATRDEWARRWSHRRAALLWGLDIGSFFSTWLTFSGAWWVVAVALLCGDSAFAASLFASWWLARSLTVWSGPLLVPNATLTPRLVIAWHHLYRPFQVTHGFAVLAGAGIVAGLAVGATA